MLVDFKVYSWLLVFAFILEHFVDVELWVVYIEVFVTIAVLIVILSLFYCIGRGCERLLSCGNGTRFDS